MIELDLIPVIVPHEIPAPLDVAKAALDAIAPVSLSDSVRAIERLLRPDMTGQVDHPFGDHPPATKAPKPGQVHLSPNFIRTAGILAVRGFSNQEIAEAFGVGLSEVKLWEREYPDFKECLSRCKDMQDHVVERSLYNVATGYSYPAVDIKVDKDGIVTRTPYIEHVPPNVPAIKEWLHNRLPDKWRPISPDDGSVGGGSGQGGGKVAVQVVLYSPLAGQGGGQIVNAGGQAGQITTQIATQPGRAAMVDRMVVVDFDEGEGDSGGYGPCTHGGYSSVTNSQKNKNQISQENEVSLVEKDSDYSPFNDPDFPPVNTVGGVP
jgi:hypothetical protein